MTTNSQPPFATALITGVTGQDGSYLSESLLADGVRVVGTTRNATGENARRFTEHLGTRADAVELVAVDLADPDAVAALFDRTQPDRVFHLAGQSHVGRSFEAPLETLDANARATLVLLEEVRRQADAGGEVRFLQASSSELFGSADQSPQTEQTPLRPCSPYACSKAYAYLQTIAHRQTYGLKASNAILYNHESPRRPEQYVTRKITRAAARIAAGLQKELVLGRLDVGRDWGDARDTVRAMRLILEHDAADDFIVATNTWHTLEQFLDAAFGAVELDWRDYVRQDAAFMRPQEVRHLQGDASKAQRELGWTPAYSFERLVREMVEADRRLIESEVTAAPSPPAEACPT